MSSSVSATKATPGTSGFRRVWRALRQLFYEAAGAIFAVMAFAWVNSALRAWTRDVAHWLVYLACAMSALFVFFAVSSFRRARRV